MSKETVSKTNVVKIHRRIANGIVKTLRKARPNASPVLLADIANKAAWSVIYDTKLSIILKRAS